MATVSLTPASSLASSDRSFSNASDYSVYADPNTSKSDNASSSQSQNSSWENSRGHDFYPVKDGYVRSINRKGTKEETFPNQKVETFDEYSAEAEIWDPPEPQNIEDEKEPSQYRECGCSQNGDYSNDDDSKRCCDERIIDCKDSKSKTNQMEEMKKDMLDTAYKKFKNVVKQLIRSSGVSLSTEDAESWVDTASSLSWEAASLLQVAAKGKAIDPYAHVKVKCIATGSRSHSQVFRGLVFKKRAAHKHMPTEFKRPKVLLIQGVLGESSSELSSFEAMKEDYAKTVFNQIKMCCPNVILVEKSVSRDVQECFLKCKETTLFYDMKIHRLERVARCLGSPIVSFDALNDLQLNRCHSFHIEKHIEEHANVAEGEKKPSKTLMFLEGCCYHRGCTILLKGSSSNELKKIKQVVQSVVSLAYHLILETYYLVDQQMMFSTIALDGGNKVFLQDKNSRSHNMPVPCHDETATEVDVDVENGSFDEQPYSAVPYNPFLLVAAPLLVSTLWNAGKRFLKKVHGEEPSVAENVSVDSDASNEPNLESEQATDTKYPSSISDDVSVTSNSVDGIGKDPDCVLYSWSILISKSKRNVRKGTICEQIHISHILFNKNFDVPLGEFLQADLLNQKNYCNVCEEPPENHFHNYVHHNMQLTIQISRLPDEKCLPRKEEGKVWMWSCCGRCKISRGCTKSTKRVLVSAAALGLSFGHFLELSFSKKTLSGRLASCGHYLDRDFLYFFGSGTMVAMFRYCQFPIYAVSLPPERLDFSVPIEKSKLEKEFEDVYRKAVLMHEEIASFLCSIKSLFGDSAMKGLGSHGNFLLIEGMLQKEISEFEGIKKAFYSTSADGAFSLLRLNRIRWELLLQACIWDRRFASLHLPDPSVIDTSRGDERLQEGKANGMLCNGRPKFVEGNGIVTDRKSSFGEEENVLSEIPIEESLVQNQIGVQQDTSNVPKEPEEQVPMICSVAGFCEHSNPCVSEHQGLDELASITSEPENAFSTSDWFWLPFSLIRHWRITDIEKHYLPTFEPVSKFLSEHLSRALEMMTEEGLRSRITIGDDHHLLLDFEDEPSSLIAFSLARDYNHEASRISCMKSKSLDASIVPKAKQVPWEELRHHSFDGLNLLETASSQESLRREDNFGTSFGKSKYTVTTMYPTHFRRLRESCCPSETDYIASLSRCMPWDAKGGKSKSFFAKTLDDRFILKGIKKTEFDSFVKFAPHYFNYMSESFEKKNQTCLAKVLGIYQVFVRHSRSGREIRYDLMVMENLGYGRNITRTYDLKGALYDRLNTAKVAGDVLLDQNFVDDMNSSPLYVNIASKRHLQRAVWNDAGFLNRINVMDYSLLVGVDDERRELVCGIIDYLRQYTWDKQLETWVKSSLVVPKNIRPTIISPADYKQRFRKFTGGHFYIVPDDWYAQASSDVKDKHPDGKVNDA